MNVLAVSFHTEDYREYGVRLAISAHDHGVELADVRVADTLHLSSWKKAVMWKPRYILECLETLNSVWGGILWTDADSVFKSKPDFTVFNELDFACHVFKRSPHHDLEYLTGTMFFARKPIVIDFVKAWAERTKEYEYSNTPEQAALKQTLVEDGWAGKLKVARLDPEWCWIHDDFPKIYGYRFPIIEHYQASRLKRREEKFAAQKAKQAKKGRKA